jgi:hypothetical protein
VSNRFFELPREVASREIAPQRWTSSISSDFLSVYFRLLNIAAFRENSAHSPPSLDSGVGGEHAKNEILGAHCWALILSKREVNMDDLFRNIENTNLNRLIQNG